MKNEQNEPITSPVDKLYLGLVPLTIFNTIKKFLRETNQPHVHDLRIEFNSIWNELISHLLSKPVISQQAIRGVLMAKKKEYIHQHKDVYIPKLPNFIDDTINQHPIPTPASSDQSINPSQLRTGGSM